MDEEYEACHNSFFLPAGMQEPPPEWFTLDDERACYDGEEDDDASKLPNLPLPPASASADSFATSASRHRRSGA